MALLPNDFEKEYQKLLYDYWSDDTKKTKRILIVSSFVIIIVNILNKSFSDLTILGIELEGSNEKIILTLGIILIGYWIIMLVIYTYRDYEIFREKRRNSMTFVESVKNDVEHCKKTMEDSKKNGTQELQSVTRNDYVNVKNQYEIFLKMLKRISKALKLRKFTNIVQIGLPLVLGFIAILFLILDLI